MPLPLDLLVDGAVLVGDEVAGQQRRLAVDREGAAGLVDVGGLAHQAGRLVDLWLATAGHDHDLDPGPVAGLEAARLGQREAALGVAEERAAPSEQGAVEVGVDATQCHGAVATVAACPGSSPIGPSTSEQPVAAGIVNVTADSMFEGARSGTPEQAVADGLALVEAGFDMLDVGAVAARSGPPVGAEQEAAALVPAIEGLAGRELPVSADTFSVEVARRALAAGAVAVNDISGGSEEMFELVARDGLRLRADAHRGAAAGRSAGARLRRRGRAPEVLVRGESRAWPRDLGWQRSRSRSTPDSTSTSPPRRTWRSCGGSASCARSACRSTSRSRARTSSARFWRGAGRGGCRPGEREWGTVAAATLAVREGADVLRIHDRGTLQAVRVAGRIARHVRRRSDSRNR